MRNNSQKVSAYPPILLIIKAHTVYQNVQCFSLKYAFSKHQTVFYKHVAVPGSRRTRGYAKRLVWGLIWKLYFQEVFIQGFWCGFQLRLSDRIFIYGFLFVKGVWSGVCIQGGRVWDPYKGVVWSLYTRGLQSSVCKQINTYIRG